ncbi:MAG: CotH kinase family protein [Clostridiales bacterium]|nr:CotH kinase family protein [Clostridiales bacterium]
MKKQIVLGVSLMGIAFLLLFFCIRERVQVMDVQILSEHKIKALQEERTPFDASVQTALQVNGVDAAWEQEEQRYYIPRNMQEEHWKGTLGASVDGVPAFVVWEEDAAFADIREAVAEGHEFRCMVYNDSGYALVSVLFTGLPVMSIDGNMGEQGTRITVFDPVLSARDGYQTEETLAYYNIRGNASKRFEKLGYRLEFFYDDGSEGRDISLLGMREDNDWQLKAMYSDRSKLRDKLSIELWNRIAEQTETKADDGCHMEYLELIINGEYRGLYGLVEPTDYKSLGLDKTRDLIYKAAADEWPNDSLFDVSEAEQSFVCAGISIRQADKTFYPGIWDPFRTFWNHGYEMESQEDLEVLYGCIDRQNFIEYDLYYNAIAGMDNRFKNIIYSTVMESDGTYLIRRIPWDQNYSWGDDFDPEEGDIKNIVYNPDLAEKWLNEEVFRNMQAYDTALPGDMYATWKSWRETFLKEDIWKSYAREQMDYLVDSGAFARDTKKWQDSGNVPDTEEIETFIDTRFVWLDEYLKI